jgi:hypothetical protein
MSDSSHGPSWCTVAEVTTDTDTTNVGAVICVHASYYDAIAELEHPDELWARYDSPAVGDQITRGCGRAVSS